MLTLNDGRSELWQWDTGRTLAVDADCSQVHFSNKVFGRSIDVDVIDGVAIIPDILLQTDKDLSVWAFVGTAENGYTKISKTFKVNRRNKPADYVFTPPEQTTLAELSGRLDRIEESQDPDAIKNAVEDYLKQNPVESPVQSVNGQTGEVELTAEDVGAISQDDLQTATNEALAQAKASGEFDGTDGITPHIGDNGNWYLGYTDTGKPIRGETGPAGADGKSAYQYARDGGYTGTEEEFAAKLAAEMPDKLPNPNALTFTGAVEGSYDGSEEKTINIPSGGEKDWKYEKYVEFSEETAGFEFTAYDDETPFDFTEVEISAALKNATTESVWGDVTVFSDGIAHEGGKIEQIGGTDSSVSIHTASGKWYFCYLRGHIDAKNKSIEAMISSDANILYVNAPFVLKKTTAFQKPNFCYSVNAEQNHWDTPPTKFTTIKSGMTIGAGSSILIRGR